jgi:hypothetical protein
MTHSHVGPVECPKHSPWPRPRLPCARHFPATPVELHRRQSSSRSPQRSFLGFRLPPEHGPIESVECVIKARIRRVDRIGNYEGNPVDILTGEDVSCLRVSRLFLPASPFRPAPLRACRGCRAFQHVAFRPWLGSHVDINSTMLHTRSGNGARPISRLTAHNRLRRI